MRTLTFNRVVGSGAMGSVYHAELRAPQGFSRACAVKVMKPVGGEHAHLVERMRDEARLLGLLHDEQILGVSELLRVDGRDAVVMEFVEGADLSELRAIAPMPPRALAELGAELAGTLHRAHRASHPSTGVPLQVIHRDVKPANIMVTSRGGVRLLDFGVARAVFGGREAETRGLVLGTFNYFPPEIILGADPTPAVDVFGLGLSLWECAAGEAWGTPVMQQSRFEQRIERRLSQLPNGYDALHDVIRDMLAFEPQDRPDGGQVEARLLAIADELPGSGLRTWARRVVPQALSGRVVDLPDDDLTGRTFDVGNPVSGEAEPAPVASPVETRWVSAADREGMKPVRSRSAPQPVMSEPVTQRKPVGRRGPPMWAILAIGALVGLVVGTLILLTMMVIVVVMTR